MFCCGQVNSLEGKKTGTEDSCSEDLVKHHLERKQASGEVIDCKQVTF